MKKTALAMVLISALLLSNARVVEIVEANPYWWYTHVEPVPGTTPPAISIYSPQNNTDYSTDNITVDFSVDPPKLAGWSTGSKWVVYFIDGKPSQDITPSSQGEHANFTLSSLTTGSHRLTIEASVAMLGAGPKVFFLDCNSTVSFTTSFPTPTPKATPEATSQPATFPATIISVGSVGIALVAIGLVVYFKKRKKDKNQ